MSVILCEVSKKKEDTVGHLAAGSPRQLIDLILPLRHHFLFQLLGTVQEATTGKVAKAALPRIRLPGRGELSGDHRHVLLFTPCACYHSRIKKFSGSSIKAVRFDVASVYVLRASVFAVKQTHRSQRRQHSNHQHYYANIQSKRYCSILALNVVSKGECNLRAANTNGGMPPPLMDLARDRISTRDVRFHRNKSVTSAPPRTHPGPRHDEGSHRQVLINPRPLP
ncbi:unnamed protein product, partial [Iphiclides podalirius]